MYVSQLLPDFEQAKILHRILMSAELSENDQLIINPIALKLSIDLRKAVASNGN